MRVEATEAFADRVLAHRLSAHHDARDRAFATQLVYGTLAWQGRLDYHLDRLLRTPRAELDPSVRAALRLGLYQVLFLDRVPSYAAVDSSVRLARRACGAGAAALVNAVLRRATATDDLTLPNAERDPIGRLAVEWSHPRWLVARWADALGSELPALLAACNARGGTTLRANALRTTPADLAGELSALGMEVRRGRWARTALRIAKGAGRLRNATAYREGRLAFQSEASQLVSELLAPPPGAHVLDVCAAPGGKTAHLAALLAGTGLVAAVDVRPGGAARIRDDCRRLHARPILAAAADARRPPFARVFDAVLVDAPCSGLGTLRRHPEVRWRRTPADVARLAALQRDLTDAVASLVRPGGVLVYAVCTLLPEENEDVVTALRAAHPRFAVESAASYVPVDLVDGDGFLRTWPHRHDLDGFFAARLRARM